MEEGLRKQWDRMLKSITVIEPVTKDTALLQYMTFNMPSYPFQKKITLDDCLRWAKIFFDQRDLVLIYNIKPFPGIYMIIWLSNDSEDGSFIIFAHSISHVDYKVPPRGFSRGNVILNEYVVKPVGSTSSSVISVTHCT
jgi:hypothetical protein